MTKTQSTASYDVLPEGYTESRTISLSKNRKLLIGVNAIAVILFVLLYLLGMRIRPAFDVDDNGITFSASTLQILVTAAALVGYVVGHEWVHGLCFRRYSGKKARYGFTGLYAYAASDAYFSRGPYLVIGLAPVVVFGLLFLLLNLLLPDGWFWPVYFLQMMNLAGAAGDILVTAILLRMPSDLLVLDEGSTIHVYTRAVQTL